MKATKKADALAWAGEYGLYGVKNGGGRFLPPFFPGWQRWRRAFSFYKLEFEIPEIIGVCR